MWQENKFCYAQTDICQAVTLPYGNGAFSMTVLLPAQGKTVADVAAQLTADSWDILMPRNVVSIDLKLPRFETKTDQDLVDIMKLLGMKRAFDSREAEFPNFCDRSTFISQMKLSARIKLNEEGTEAAAVTAIGVANTGVAHVAFHATRPFLYVISEKSTGTIFFIGQYTGKS
jgi:serpin B